MDYNEKKKFIGKVAYIILSIMTVTILCITVYTFIGSFRRNDEGDIPTVTDKPEDNGNITMPQDNQITSNPHPETDGEANRAENETKPAQEVNAEVPDVKNELPASHSYAMPVEGVVSKKHSLDCAVYSLTMGDYRIHSGIDIEAPVGSTVSACAYGTIKSVYTDPFEGKCIVIDHGNGVLSYYKNLADATADGIKEGKAVNQGETLGAVGESSPIEIADSPHLHFEMTISGKKIDPLEYLPISASSETGETAKIEE